MLCPQALRAVPKQEDVEQLINEQLETALGEAASTIAKTSGGISRLAAKRTTRDLYAIKVIRKKDLQRKNQIEHIKTEREVMAHAEHPFVVRLYYSFTSADNLYMVMEFVNGGETPLSDPVPPPRSVRCLDQAATSTRCCATSATSRRTSLASTSRR